MGIAENKEVVRNYCDALSAGDIAAFAYIPVLGLAALFLYVVSQFACRPNQP